MKGADEQELPFMRSTQLYVGKDKLHNLSPAPNNTVINSCPEHVARTVEIRTARNILVVNPHGQTTWKNWKIISERIFEK
jgi:hypothetical protein